ncbi:competence type IV pilus major pilin ComGC [Lapidilactobacillus wuchangensis]|uniref:competence type IV pilus major pilin ComGC n=1 Tax=Lapidilactobacillus wuchangensis TaxID=2486001 RepID=UPI000F79DBD8|nr:competence type IV pilus major pilin ComGC [Lapidilactobacillus wuchangensis]
MKLTYFKRQQQRKAFTLIEMSLVLLIIALLLLIMIPNIAQQKNKASAQIDQAFIKNMETQTTLYQTSETENASWAALEKSGYISSDQRQKAESLNLVIKGDGSIATGK